MQKSICRIPSCEALSTIGLMLTSVANHSITYPISQRSEYGERAK